MAIALVGTPSRLSSGTSTGTTATVAIAPTAGNKLVAVVSQGATPQTVTPSTVGAATTWTKADGINNGTVNQTDIWYADNIPAGITAVKITFAAAVKNTVTVYQLSGANAGSAQNNHGTGSASPASVALPLAALTTDFVIACASTAGTNNTAETFGTVTGWTQDTEQTVAKSAQQAPAHRVAAATTNTYNPTVAGSLVWSAAIASFKLASSNTTVTPGTASLTLTVFAPSVTVSANITVTPGTATPATTLLASTVTVSDNKSVTPGTVSATLTAFAPTVTVAPAGISVTPGTVTTTLTTYAPAVTASFHVTVTPGTASFALTAFGPTVTATANISVTIGAPSLSVVVYAPTVTATGPHSTKKAQDLTVRAVVFHAVAILEVGKGFGITDSDHTGSESCTQTIARIGGRNTDRRTDAVLADIARTAVYRLKAGSGWDVSVADHAGGNTCVEAIVANTA